MNTALLQDVRHASRRDTIGNVPRRRNVDKVPPCLTRLHFSSSGALHETKPRRIPKSGHRKPAEGSAPLQQLSISAHSKRFVRHSARQVSHTVTVRPLLFAGQTFAKDFTRLAVIRRRAMCLRRTEANTLSHARFDSPVPKCSQVIILLPHHRQTIPPFHPRHPGVPPSPSSCFSPASSSSH